MLNRNLALSACCFVLLTVSSVSPSGAGSTETKAMRVTFSQPVGLPGVGLAAGSYIFQVPDPIGAWDVVQVLSKDGSKAYFMAHTLIVEKPSGLRRGQVVSLGEAVPGAPTPVTVWYPDNESGGRQFIYPTTR